MYKVSNVRYLVKKNISFTDQDLVRYVYHYLQKNKVKDIRDLTLIKKSLDARHPDLYYELSASFNSVDEFITKVKNVSEYTIKQDEELLDLLKHPVTKAKKIIVVGMGPAGLFSAYVLAKAGFDVTILEQGKPVEERMKDIDIFQKTGKLNSLSNIHFGEGGAGTFSDGKLQTGITSPLIRFVYETFVSFGADSNILYESYPHIGTDVLRNVIINMRKELLKLGVNIHYNSKVTSFDEKTVYAGSEMYPYDKLILACGHSAKTIYHLLKEKHVEMSPKSFAVGVRIEHLQKDINQALYHGEYSNLPAMNYKLVTHLKSGRSVFSFCMCPGGEVVNASSEDGLLVVNGMSYHARNGLNANSALLVNINPSDFYQGDILDGVKFQEELEQKAYNVSKNNLAPVCLVKDFHLHKISTGLGKVTPTVKPGYVFTNLWDILPDYVSTSIDEALPIFDQKIKGFNADDAVLTAVESRSSSPITVIRNDNFESSYQNLYVIGEGSGASGGITTSAIDGVKCAIKIYQLFKNQL